ncbi:hypothetical protein IJG21_00210 [Candidatus Saccharibacteria bacterium]|nr:hypothetical protein [Candidatus Saccharibacteria bacterium]
MNPADFSSFFVKPSSSSPKKIEEIPINSEKKSYKKPLSRKFERIFLGSILSFLFSDEKLPFSLIASESSNFDDEINRVDCLACLSFDAPVLEEESELSFSYLPLGFDITVSGERKKILEKLVKSSKNPDPLPFGFTKLKFFKTPEEIREEPLVPRFVVGVSDYDVDSLSRAVKSPDSLSAQKFRFKILSELKTELDFYLSMLPDSFNPEVAKKSLGFLSLFNKILNASLEECSLKLLDEELIETSEKNPFKLRSALENYFIKESKEAFREEKLSRNLRPGYNRSRVTDDDAYAQILTLGSELLATAFDPSSKISALRNITPRSSAL